MRKTQLSDQIGYIVTLELYHLALPAGKGPMKIEDIIAFDLWLLEQGNAEIKAELTAMKSAHNPESTDPPPVEEQPESAGAAAQPDTTSLSQPKVASSVATTQVCTLDDNTDRACETVFPAGALHDGVCFDHQLEPGTPAVLPDADCHSLSPDQLDQQPPQQQQGSSSSEHRSAQRKLASTVSRFFRRLGGTPKTEQVLLTGTARASPVVDKSNVSADPQSQHSVSSPKNHVAMTADASMQHGRQSGSRPSTAVTPIGLLSQAAFPVATAQHPVYSCTPPSLLWHTPAEDARGSSAMTVTDAPQLPGETGQPSPESQKVSEERAESAGVQPTFAHDAQEQHIDPPSNRCS